MNTEEEFLKKDFEKIDPTDKEGFEKFKQDVEDMGGHEDLAALAQEKINALNTQAETIVVQPAERIETIQNLGGSSEELIEKVVPVQDEVEKVQVETVEKIDQVEKVDLISQQNNDLASVLVELNDLRDRKVKGLENGTELDALIDQKQFEFNGIIDNLKELTNKKGSLQENSENTETPLLKLQKWNQEIKDRITFLNNANQSLAVNNPGPIMVKSMEAHEREIRQLEAQSEKLQQVIQESREESSEIKGGDEKSKFLEQISNLKTELAPYLDSQIHIDSSYDMYDIKEYVTDTNYVGGGYTKHLEIPEDQQKQLVDIFKKYYQNNPKHLSESELKYIPINYGSGAYEKNTFTIGNLLNEVEKDFS